MYQGRLGAFKIKEIVNKSPDQLKDLNNFAFPNEQHNN